MSLFNNLDNNYSMLIKIAQVIGGTVRVVNNKKEVIWVADKKETINIIIDIFTKYPPLTSRLICQLEFLKVCLKNNSVEKYLFERSFKYSNQLKIVKQFNENFIVPNYFSSWLSGFIEAKGCFLVRKNNKNSFSIGQNEDYYLLQTIKKFFNLSVMVRNPYKNFYFLETYKKESLSRIIAHCIDHPLLGEKSKSFYKFIKVCASH